MKYRPDVDGLRAVAILPVVLFHARIGAFAGGFVGVDVFFVVSGFLITSLIAGEIREGRFSIAHFYERRIRRIFPALFSTVFACAAAAAALLPAAELKAFGLSVAAVALFGSNVLFFNESGYFDAPAEAKPLLHTWSLAVEEQFYIFFPLFLLLLHRYLKGCWRVALAVVAALSLALCIQATQASPSAAFYLAPYRGWELLLGALVAIGCFPTIHSRGGRDAAAVLGIAMIGWSVFTFSEATAFPGVAALLPCIGTLLIIHAGGSGGSALNQALSWRPVVWVGLISYSLYLWHWPILVFARVSLLRELTLAEIAAALGASFLLATLSWRFIERPFRRHGGGIGRRALFAGAVGVMALALGLGALSPRGEARGESLHVRGREDYRDGNCFLGEKQVYADWAAQGPCTTSHRARYTILLWGDSFAAHYVPGLFDGPQDTRYGFVQYTAYGCPPVPGARVRWAPNCEDVNRHIEDVLRRHPVDAVIMAARWERYWGKSVTPEMLEHSIAVLKARGLPVVLVGQGPSFEFADPALYVRRTGRDSAPSRDFGALNRAVREVAGYDRYFDPLLHLCREGQCTLKESGEFLYWDAGHYSSYGSHRISGNLRQTLSGLIHDDAN